MFIRKKRNASGSISVQIIEKIGRNNKVVQTIGSSKDEIEIELLYEEGLKLIPQLTKQPILNLFPNDNSENIIDTFVKNLSTNSIVCIGPELIIARLFDYIGGYAFNSNNFSNEESSNQVLRIGNIRNDCIILDDKQVFVSDEIVKPIARFKIEYDDILFSMTAVTTQF